MRPRHTRSGATILRDSVRSNAPLLSGAALLLCLHQACEVAVPVLIGVIIDRAVTNGDLGSLATGITWLAAVFVALTICYRLGARLAMRAALDQAHRLRVQATRRVLDRAMLDTDLRSGELMAVAGTDADETAALLRYLPQAAGALAAVAVCGGALLVIDIPLGLAVFVGVPVLLLGLQLTAPGLTRQMITQQQGVAETSGSAADLIAGLRPLRGIGAEEAAASRYQTSSQDALVAMRRAARGQGMFMGAAAGISAILAVGVATAAGWFALSGRISVGELVTVLGIAQFFLEPLAVLSMLPGKVSTARASAERLALISDADVVKSRATMPLGPGPHGIEFRGVEYNSLRGLDLIVKPGECVGIVATSAHDAHAILALMSGVATPSAGGVRVSNVPAECTDTSERPRPLLIAPHATDLFTGSVMDNLRAGDDNLDRIAVGEVLRTVAGEDVAAAHTDGLDHVVADRGYSLSGGQRQRLALVRALLADPAVLVLHDPTTSIDAVTERAVAQRIHRLRHQRRADRTTVVITSSPTLLSVMDRVVLVDGGRAERDGAHAELTAMDNRYREAVLR